jgi:uncharacterized protein (TIGR01777 family)
VVLLTGATGFVGSRLAERLRENGHTVRTVSRKGGDHDWSEPSLKAGVEAAEAVIHLAGENLFGRRWSAKQKQLLVESRVMTTQLLAQLAGGCPKEQRPEVFLTASAVGYYGPSEQVGLTEDAPFATDFLGRLCERWEQATLRAERAGIRVAHVRIGVVMGPGGGALAKMLPPFKLGLGGPLGSGKQWVSWIHRDDLVDLFIHLLEHDGLEGPFNGTAPDPVTMKQLARTLGRVLHRPAILPVPGFVMKLALGEVADILLTGQHVIPKKARESGFTFTYPELEGALKQVLGKG